MSAEEMNTQIEKDKSWGMVGFYRTYGGGKELFGSDVTNHNTIRLTIKHARKHRELGKDWTMGDDIICEVELSALQFAELLTNMNVGDGVPCTIKYTREDGCIEYKNEKNKIAVIQEERSEQIDKASSNLQEVITQLNELINMGALGIANMWTAIFADVGVMVLAVLNSIRGLQKPQ